MNWSSNGRNGSSVVEVIDSVVVVGGGCGDEGGDVGRGWIIGMKLK